jgi:hypothetical protein
MVVEYHAFTILSATGRTELTPDLVNALALAYETDYDWITTISSAAISRFGEQAVEPLMRCVREFRDSLPASPSCATYARTIRRA